MHTTICPIFTFCVIAAKQDSKVKHSKIFFLHHPYSEEQDDHTHKLNPHWKPTISTFKNGDANRLRAIMQNSDNHYDANMTMIRIQALEWVQGTGGELARYTPLVIFVMLDWTVVLT